MGRASLAAGGLFNKLDTEQDKRHRGRRSGGTGPLSPARWQPNLCAIFIKGERAGELAVDA